MIHSKPPVFADSKIEGNEIPSLPSLAHGIARIGKNWLAQYQDNVLCGELCQGAEGLVSQWSSTIKSPCMCTVTCWYQS